MIKAIVVQIRNFRQQRLIDLNMYFVYTLQWPAKCFFRNENRQVIVNINSFANDLIHNHFVQTPTNRCSIFVSFFF